MQFAPRLHVQLIYYGIIWPCNWAQYFWFKCSNIQSIRITFFLLFAEKKPFLHNLMKCFRITLSSHQALHTSTFRWIGLTAVFDFRKSTFFNVLTKSQAAAENFPFCTIDPNESRVPIPDERYDFLCQFHKPARYGFTSFTYYSHFRSVVFSLLVWENI